MKGLSLSTFQSCMGYCREGWRRFLMDALEKFLLLNKGQAQSLEPASTDSGTDWVWVNAQSLMGQDQSNAFLRANTSLKVDTQCVDFTVITENRSLAFSNIIIPQTILLIKSVPSTWTTGDGYEGMCFKNKGKYPSFTVCSQPMSHCASCFISFWLIQDSGDCKSQPHKQNYYNGIAISLPENSSVFFSFNLQ